jgi:glycosyltransferase involved in cell wall biosynthesis
MMGALVEIEEVALAEPLAPELRRGFVDEPRAGAVLDAHAVDVLGWSLGARTRAVAVEFSIGGEPFWRAPLRAERADLAEVFADVPEARRAGFATTLNLIGTPAEFELRVATVLKGRRRAPLATIRGRHRWRRERSPAFAELVSVVVACRGQARQLGETIESALAQTYPHVEVVVVDDGFTDEASLIAARHPGVRCIRTCRERAPAPGRRQNAGAAQARNAGARSTNGDFLVFLDAGDLLSARAIEAGMRMLDLHPACAAAVGACHGAEHDGGGRPGTHAGPAVAHDQYARLMRDDWAGSSARAIYRRSLLEHVRGFEPGLDAVADFAFNLAVARQFPIARHETPVAECRERGSESGCDPAEKLVQTLEAMRRQRRHVRRDRELRRAYRDGVGHWKRCWGQSLAEQARESLRDGRRREALGQLVLLARRWPRGVWRLLRARRSRSG